jgi:hypothetical protein
VSSRFYAYPAFLKKALRVALQYRRRNDGPALAKSAVSQGWIWEGWSADEAREGQVRTALRMAGRPDPVNGNRWRTPRREALLLAAKPGAGLRSDGGAGTPAFAPTVRVQIQSGEVFRAPQHRYLAYWPIPRLTHTHPDGLPGLCRLDAARAVPIRNTPRRCALRVT